MNKSSKSQGKSLAYYEDASNDYLEGGADELGEAILWSNSPVYDEYSQLVAYTTGTCHTVSEDPLLYFCNYLVAFKVGYYAGSTLTFQGEYPDYGEDSFAYNTITGGSGYFAGVSGIIKTEQPASADAELILIHNIMFE
jgi:hypothetical protein